MSDEQDAIKNEYKRMARKRSELQKLVNQEQEKWSGRAERPMSLVEAERNRDDADIALARIADKIKL